MTHSCIPAKLAGLSEVVSSGGNAVIYYSGHAARRGPGQSKATFNGQRWTYVEDGVLFAGPPYLISGNYSGRCERIYGRDFHAVIKKMPLGRTITMVFDACHISTFFGPAIDFSYVYKANADGGSEAPSQGKARGSQTQIIFVAAAQFGELARTFKQKDNPDEQNGAVTVLMDEFFQARRGPRTAQALVDKLYGGCYKRNQRPQIYSLFPVVGNFEILP
ncbi:hypothetical protein FRC01_011764 [Tulasnella sp. 417]|nr:hypothetical protein FRC01_011764 [Tulasnella sp. 417]